METKFFVMDVRNFDTILEQTVQNLEIRVKAIELRKEKDRAVRSQI